MNGGEDTKGGIRKIAFLGKEGSYSHMACLTARAEMEPVPCASFEEAFGAARDGLADLAMIPVDNSLAGRVADVHTLLPGGELFIVGEHFQPIRHTLMGVKGASLSSLRRVYSHVHALAQCRAHIRQMGLTTEIHPDSASAAAFVAGKGDPADAAISSPLSAQLYDLDILAEDMQDAPHNTTRFLLLARQAATPPRDPAHAYMTSFYFKVRNLPAALYKSLGGFATNGVNIVKLESYVDERLNAARFYCDVEGHLHDRSLQLAFEELDFFATEIRMLGTYPAHAFRKNHTG